VDGVISSRDQRELKRLVRSNPEARALLRSLMSDSGEIQLAPAVAAPASLSANVMKAIESQPPRPVPATVRVPAPEPALPVRWFWGYAAAAIVFVTVGGGSFFLHRPGSAPVAPGPDRGRSGGMAERPAEPTPDKTPQPEVIVKTDSMTPWPVWEDFPPTVKVNPDDDAELEIPMAPVPLPKPSELPRPVLASPSRELGHQLERVEFTLPRVHIFHGLDVAEQDQALRDQFALGTRFRIEIPARDANRGFERLRQTLGGQRVQLTIPVDVQARLKKPIRSDFAIYVENIAPEQLADALKQAGLADRVAAQKRAIELTYEGPLIVREMVKVDRRELKDLLGLDPFEVRPSFTPPSVDIRTPLPEATGAAINDTLNGQGVPRPGAGPGVGLVLALPANRMRAPEVKKFMESRPVARPGTLNALIVLRNVY
jgi:hypothetical protein